jgi:hypothetical protein
MGLARNRKPTKVIRLREILDWPDVPIKDVRTLKKYLPNLTTWRVGANTSPELCFQKEAETQLIDAGIIR